MEKLQNGEPLEGKDGVLAPLIKKLIEASLEGELDSHLEEEKVIEKSNRRNGKASDGCAALQGTL